MIKLFSVKVRRRGRKRGRVGTKRECRQTTNALVMRFSFSRSTSSTASPNPENEMKQKTQEKQKADAESAASGGPKKQSPGELRLQKGKKGEERKAKRRGRERASERERKRAKKERGSTSKTFPLSLPPPPPPTALPQLPLLSKTLDMSELTSIHGVRIDLSTGPDASPLNFTITVAPDEGAYRSGRFVFDVRVSATGYPHEPPKVKCATKVFHPNIDVEGNVCLNILREDWKPVLSISHVAYGLTHLFLDPNPSDPLNKEAAEMLRASPRQFEQAVAMAVSRGAQIGGRYFPPCRA